MYIYSPDTIILVHGETNFPTSHWMKQVQPGEAIFGIDNERKEIRRWSIDQKAEALAELARYKCTYHRSGGHMWADEYALEYCLCDEDGKFLEGSDFTLAELA